MDSVKIMGRCAHCNSTKLLTPDGERWQKSIAVFNNVPIIEHYACRETMLAETASAIEHSIGHASVSWREMALEAVRQVCLKMDEFTVNDVREIVKRSKLTTRDNRAMGGVMKTAEAQKWLEGTGRSIPSVVGHKVPIQIWRSLLRGKK